MSRLDPTSRFFIGGHWVEPSSTRRLAHLSTNRETPARLGRRRFPADEVSR